MYRISISAHITRTMLKREERFLLVFAIVILIIAIILAIVLSHRQSTKMKYIIWGITTILVIAPLLSWLAGILFAINVW